MDDIQRIRLWLFMHLPDVSEMETYKDGWFGTEEFLQKTGEEITLRMLQGMARFHIIVFGDNEKKFRIASLKEIQSYNDL